MIPLTHGLILASVLFVLGLTGLVIRRNLLFMLISLEIMINAAALAFVVAGSYWGQTDGQMIAPDMQNALRLNDEIRQFTDSMVAGLADWETLPYDSFSPHQDIISSRLATLYQLPTMERGVLIIPVSTLMQRVCPHNFLHGHALVMKKGQRLSRDALRAQLDSAGYRHVDQVMEHGEYATRGALLDLFPMGSEQPYRLDFFDDEIDSLRLFDVDSQRTLEEVASINLLPAHEFPTDQAAIELFRSQWRDRFEVKRDAEHIYQQVSKGTLPAGIEYWQPLFFNEPLQIGRAHV